MPRMTWRDAAIALHMQKVVDLSSLTNLPAFHVNSARSMCFLSFYPLVTASRCHEEECHGSMSYRQDFIGNVAHWAALVAQDTLLAGLPSSCRKGLHSKLMRLCRKHLLRGSTVLTCCVLPPVHFGQDLVYSGITIFPPQQRENGYFEAILRGRQSGRFHFSSGKIAYCKGWNIGVC